MIESNAAIFERLFNVIQGRRGGDPEQSYVARQFERGTSRIAQKVGEEAIETALAAVCDDKNQLISESADLLFHLMMLWADRGLEPNDIFAELIRREGVSGLDAKNAGKDC